NILDQIKERHIDLCQEDYYRYIRIGLAIASKFGESGEEYFHFVCSFGSKYNEKDARKDYKGFVANGNKVSIGTFYYYCKEAGIEVYSERTKEHITRVKVSKQFGNPTIESVSKNLVALGVEPDEQLINTLINSKEDFSKLAESELTDIERLQKFIVDSFEPEIDEITHIKYVNSRIMEDTQVEDIYIACKKNFDFNVNKNDVYSILNSSCVRPVNKLKEFIHENRDIKTTGHTAEYANCIYPQSEYNVWAFTKWIVGTMHNWFCDYDDYESSPLTLVLTGNKHGSGKTSFCRHVLPKELSKYIILSKLSDNKDAKFR